MNIHLNLSNVDVLSLRTLAGNTIVFRTLSKYLLVLLLLVCNGNTKNTNHFYDILNVHLSMTGKQTKRQDRFVGKQQ